MVSNQKFSFTDITLQPEAINLSAVDQNCISNQGDRGRVTVFIDGSNLSYAASQLSIEIDYVKLLHYLTARDCLVDVLFYTEPDPTDKKQREFFHWLRSSGYRAVTRAMQAPNSAQKLNFNVEIAVDMVRLSQRYDTAILVSGNEYFIYVVDTIADQGVRVEVVGLRSMTSNSLINVADRYTDLDTIKEDIQRISVPMPVRCLESVQ